MITKSELVVILENSEFDNKEGISMETKAYLGWVDFYMELADKLLPYKNDRKTLIDKIKAIYTAINMRLPKLEADNNLVDIDPFTIFGLFNKGITNANRISIADEFLQKSA